MNTFNIETDEHGDQTVQVLNKEGAVVAEIIAVPVSAEGISIDVRPMVEAKVQNIVFGVSDMERLDDRFRYETKKHNGFIHENCKPFVCVEVNPT